MFRSLNPDGPQSSASPAGSRLSSMVQDSQESSWIGQLSRPALSLLHKLVPGRLRASAVVDSGSGWFGGESKSFVQEENEFLRKLTDLMPLPQHAPAHLSYLQCHHDGPGLVERGGAIGPLWVTPECLEPERPGGANSVLFRQPHISFISSVRTFLNQVLSNYQELRPAGGMEGPSEPVSPSLRSRPWWDSLLQGEEKSLWLEKSWHEEGAEASQLCLSPSAETKPCLFDHYSCREWTLGENTGPPHYKEELTHNGGLCTVQNPEGSAADRQHCIKPFPNRVNGFSGVEEEYSQSPPQYQVMSEGATEEQPQVDTPESASGVTEMEESSSTQGKEEEQACSGRATEPSAPQCQNKAIAFIMGCPCSDDESSQSEESSDEDDDGFDSEGSSDLSNSSEEEEEEEEEEDEDSDSEPDSDSERLWTSMCQIADPYNPLNFTACLHTGRSQPQPIHTPTPPSSTQSSPDPSPDLSTFVPPSSLDSWDESTSASEVDECESLRLLSSFSCSSDPYSLLNFQAPLRTRRPTGPPHKVKAKKPPESKSHPDQFTSASPPEYNKEEAEERMDSGFSERSGSSRSTSCRSSKKVCLHFLQGCTMPGFYKYLYFQTHDGQNLYFFH